jgi:uncharacterized protein
LASGIVEVFIDIESIFTRLPKNKILSVVLGAFLGLLFPVCECGVIPLVRRLYQKGLPFSTGIAFLLAAPILNPIVLISTYTAFGNGSVFWGRIIITFIVAAASGMFFSLHEAPEKLLSEHTAPACPTHHHPQNSTNPIKNKLIRVGLITSEEFLEMGVFLILGALVAALMQTLLPQQTLLSLGGRPIVSILIMIALGVLLSICSTVDAFVALSFAASFSSGSILAFLVYGPMVDIKSIFMYTRVFKKKAVVYLITIPLF